MDCTLGSVWILDSGCGQYATYCKEEFVPGTLRPYSGELNGIGNSKIKIKGIGSVARRCTNKNKSATITFSNVLFAPGLGLNLLSVT